MVVLQVESGLDVTEPPSYCLIPESFKLADDETVCAFSPQNVGLSQ